MNETELAARTQEHHHGMAGTMLARMDNASERLRGAVQRLETKQSEALVEYALAIAATRGRAADHPAWERADDAEWRLAEIGMALAELHDIARVAGEVYRGHDTLLASNLARRVAGHSAADQDRRFA